jgi:hypothetical protein
MGKINITKLQSEIEKVLQRFYKEEKLDPDYTEIKIRPFKYEDSDAPATKVEVRSEADYETMDDLANELDKIIKTYNKDSYFEAEDAGIISAIIAEDSGIKESVLESLHGKQEISDFFKLCKELGLETAGDLKRFADENQNRIIVNFLLSKYDLTMSADAFFETLKDYKKEELGDTFKIAESKESGETIEIVESMYSAKAPSNDVIDLKEDRTLTVTFSELEVTDVPYGPIHDTNYYEEPWQKETTVYLSDYEYVIKDGLTDFEEYYQDFLNDVEFEEYDKDPDAYTKEHFEDLVKKYGDGFINNIYDDAAEEAFDKARDEAESSYSEPEYDEYDAYEDVMRAQDLDEAVEREEGDLLDEEEKEFIENDKEKISPEDLLVTTSNPVAPYIITLYEKYPIYEPAEGGYYYDGIEVDTQWACDNLEEAKYEFEKLAKRYDLKIQGENKDIAFSEHPEKIGEGYILQIESDTDSKYDKVDNLASGYHPYE